MAITSTAEHHYRAVATVTIAQFQVEREFTSDYYSMRWAAERDRGMVLEDARTFARKLRTMMGVDFDVHVEIRIESKVDTTWVNTNIKRELESIHDWHLGKGTLRG